MKRTIWIFLTSILITTITSPIFAQKREVLFEKEFQKTLALANSDHFIVKFYIATPTVQTLFTPPGPGANINIDPKQCYLWISDSLVEGKLPYFGSGTWTSLSRLDTIKIHHVLFSRTVKIHPDGRKKAIAYQITVMTNQDIYYLNMDIQYNGTCYLYFSDRRRSPISYVGQIIPYQPTPKARQASKATE